MPAITRTNQPLLTVLVLLVTGIIFFGCKKNTDSSPFAFSNPPDLTTKITSSVNGFVTDENDQPINLATVQVGTTTVSTDKYGYFEVKNVQVVKNAATVTVTRPGYFKGIKTYTAVEGQPTFFRIKLMPKTIIGTINGATGGMIPLPNGLSVKLNPGSVVNATTNAAYTGTVNVAAFWINPTANDLNKIMPGDLRGINAAGSLNLLQTFGMLAVELSGTSGELLQIANGQKATFTIPIAALLATSAPVSIPLWYFDEATGLWKEEGTAAKTGNLYTADVSHFSFWNCDYPGNLVQYDCTVVGPNGQPVQNAFVKISLVNNSNSWGSGYTNAAGFVSGVIPANEQLKLEIFPDASCSATPLYSQIFATTTANISLGTITVNNPAFILNVTGTATDCNNAPLNSGAVILKYGYVSYAYTITNGAYNFNLPVCSSPAAVSIRILDLGTLQLSLPMSYTLNAGNNTIPNIQACGTIPAEYAYYTIDGTAYYVSTGNAYFNHTLYTLTNPPNQYDFFSVYNDPAFTVPHSGFSIVRPPVIPATSALLSTFSFYGNIVNGLPYTNQIVVTYTEYGSVGQYIAGSFAGTVRDTNVGVIRNITCSFRVKRRF